MLLLVLVLALTPVLVLTLVLVLVLVLALGHLLMLGWWALPATAVLAGAAVATRSR